MILDKRGELHRKNRESFGHERNRGSGLDGNEDVEDRKVEVKWSVIRETILGPYGERFEPPVDECQRIQMGEHDALRSASGSRSKKNVR